MNLYLGICPYFCCCLLTSLILFGSLNWGFTHWLNYCSQMINFLLVGCHTKIWLSWSIGLICLCFEVVLSAHFCEVPLLPPMHSNILSLSCSLNHVSLVCLDLLQLSNILHGCLFAVDFPPMFDPLTIPFLVVMAKLVLEVSPLSMTTLLVSTIKNTLIVESIFLYIHGSEHVRNLKILPLSMISTHATSVLDIFKFWYWSSLIHNPFKNSLYSNIERTLFVIKHPAFLNVITSNKILFQRKCAS